jgi:hypothetical protein
MLSLGLTYRLVEAGPFIFNSSFKGIKGRVDWKIPLEMGR